MPKRTLLCGLFAVMVLGLTACGDTEVKNEVPTSSKGQQLMDLKAALDAGVINKDEYEQERQRILKR